VDKDMYPSSITGGVGAAAAEEGWDYDLPAAAFLRLRSGQGPPPQLREGAEQFHLNPSQTT